MTGRSMAVACTPLRMWARHLGASGTLEARIVSTSFREYLRRHATTAVGVAKERHFPRLCAHHLKARQHAPHGGLLLVF